MKFNLMRFSLAILTILFSNLYCSETDKAKTSSSSSSPKIELDKEVENLIEMQKKVLESMSKGEFENDKNRLKKEFKIEIEKVKKLDTTKLSKKTVSIINGVFTFYDKTFKDAPCTKCKKLFDTIFDCKCKLVQYCSKECQKADWKRHKVHCKGLETLLAKKEDLERQQRKIAKERLETKIGLLKIHYDKACNDSLYIAEHQETLHQALKLLDELIETGADKSETDELFQAINALSTPTVRDPTTSSLSSSSSDSTNLTTTQPDKLSEFNPDIENLLKIERRILSIHKNNPKAFEAIREILKEEFKNATQKLKQNLKKNKNLPDHILKTVESLAAFYNKIFKDDKCTICKSLVKFNFECFYCQTQYCSKQCVEQDARKHILLNCKKKLGLERKKYNEAMEIKKLKKEKLENALTILKVVFDEVSKDSKFINNHKFVLADAKECLEEFINHGANQAEIEKYSQEIDNLSNPKHKVIEIDLLDDEDKLSSTGSFPSSSESESKIPVGETEASVEVVELEPKKRRDIDEIQQTRRKDLKKCTFSFFANSK